MRRSIGLLCLLCLLSASTTAWAEPLPEEAHGRFKEGLAAIQAKDWHQALEILSALWQEKRSYDVALLLGQVELNLERYRDAAEHLDFGVRNAAAREAPANLARATQLLELAKEHIGTLEIGANVDAEVRVDGTRVGETPLGSSVFVDPGVRTIQVAAPDFEPVTQQVQIGPGDSRHLDFTLSPSAATSGQATGSPGAPRIGSPEDDAGDSPASLKWPVVIGSGALAVAGLGAGAYFLVQRDAFAADAADLRGTLPVDACTGTASAVCDELRGVKRDGRRAERLAWTGFAAGGVLAVGAAIAWWLWPQAGEAGALRVTPLPAADTATTWGGALTGTF